MQNELKPCPCGNAVEVKYIAGIGSSLLKYIDNPFAGSTPTYYIHCDDGEAKIRYRATPRQM